MRGTADRRDEDFHDLYLARAEALRRTAFLLCGDWHRAEDLVQTSFAKLYAAWGRVDVPEAYLRTVLVRAVVDESRRPWRREHAVATPPDRAVVDDEDVDPRDALREALAHVPTRQRACLVLRFFDDLPVADVARALRCSESTVKSQTSRGLDALRRVLRETEPDLVLSHTLEMP